MSGIINSKGRNLFKLSRLPLAGKKSPRTRNEIIWPEKFVADTPRDRCIAAIASNHFIVVQIHRGAARLSSLGYRGADISSPLLLRSPRLPISHPRLSRSPHRRRKIVCPLPFSPLSLSFSLFMEQRWNYCWCSSVREPFIADVTHFEPHSHASTCELQRVRTRRR